MNWSQISPYCLMSECKGYSVAKYGSESGRFAYAAWRTKDHPQGRLMLAGNLADAQTAKLRCEADAEQVAA